MVKQEIKYLTELYDELKPQIESDFLEYLSFASVSSEPNHKADVLACAKWLSNYLQNIGLEVEQIKTTGYPLILARNSNFDPKKPTVLIYNHYDVQPAEPLELWDSPPYTPSIRNGQVYARGAQDNKGQSFYVISAIKALLAAGKALPTNVILCIEGEEEIGSPGMAQTLPQIKDKIRADHLLIVDLGLMSLAMPAVTLGIRGIATFTLTVTGAKTDLHSGTHGGIAPNPNQILAELLARLHDMNGKITIPNFYHDVIELRPEERSIINFDMSEDEYFKMFGAQLVGGEKDFKPAERAWIRPTLEINGIGGGYAGAGFKTVIPSVATAKLSCRLVPNQDPEKIALLVKNYFKSLDIPGVKINLAVHPGKGKGIRTKVDTKVARAVAQAYSEVHQTKCQFSLEGASIPIVTELTEASGAEVVLMGYGLPNDNIHAPNEHFGLDRLKFGFTTIARTLELLGRA